MVRQVKKNQEVVCKCTYTSCHYLPFCICMCGYMYAINQSNQIKIKRAVKE